MTRIKIIFAALALIASSVSIVAPVAYAQGNSIVVIDQRKIMRDSTAGKDIQTKLQSIGTQMSNELKPTETSLSTEGTSLQSRAATMTQEAIMADAALKTQMENFYRKAGEFDQLRQRRAQELSLTERKAWTDFFTALQPVLQEVVTEKGAQIMLDRSNAVYVSPSIDVTALVISKLNSRTPSIAVTRQTLPAQ